MSTEPIVYKNKQTINNTYVKQKIRELREENIDFNVNVNSIICNLGLDVLHSAINAISTAIYILQRENKMTRHIIHILLFSNRILANDDVDYELNRAEVISLLYHQHQHLETITMNEGPEGVPIWSIRSNLFNNLCTIE